MHLESYKISFDIHIVGAPACLIYKINKSQANVAMIDRVEASRLIHTGNAGLDIECH